MSSELSSKFSRDDIETLIEAIDDWEMINNQEFHILQMVKNAPLPPENHESYEYIEKIKEHFSEREKSIKASRQVRQEKSVFIKAKLIMVRRDLAVDQLFEMAVDDKPSTDVAFKESPVRRKKPSKAETEDLTAKLEAAEYFLKDLGVWDHYQRFLKERQENASDAIKPVSGELPDNSDN
jgi:hypothetical protein